MTVDHQALYTSTVSRFRTFHLSITLVWVVDFLRLDNSISLLEQYHDREFVLVSKIHTGLRRTTIWGEGNHERSDELSYTSLFDEKLNSVNDSGDVHFRGSNPLVTVFVSLLLIADPKSSI